MKKYLVAAAIGPTCNLVVPILLYTQKINEFTGFGGSPPTLAFSLVLALILLLAIPLCKKQAVRLFFDILSLAAAVLLTIVYLLFELKLFYDLPFISADELYWIIDLSLVLTCFLSGMQWYYHLAKLQETRVSYIAFIIGPLVAFFYLLIILVGGTLAMLLTCIACITNAGCSLYMQKALPDENLPKNYLSNSSRNLKDYNIDTSERKGQYVGYVRFAFFGSRILWGLSTGLLLGMSGLVPASKLTQPLWTIAVLALLFFLIIVSYSSGKKTSIPIPFFAFMPTFAYVSIAMCFIQPDENLFVCVLIGAVFLPRFLQMYIQLPSFRILARMELASFAFLARLSSYIPSLIAAAFIPFLEQETRFFSTYSDTFVSVSILYAAIIIVFSTIMICRHFIMYYPLNSSNPVSLSLDEPDHRKQFFAAIKQIAEDSHLTEREAEVFNYLAEGYSRPYIEKALFISKNTVKTHTYHIYRKLKISTQDELIEAVLQSNGKIATK